jgi:hypothetical protein
MSPELSMSPTLSLQATQAGMILGTAGDMSDRVRLTLEERIRVRLALRGFPVLDSQP